MDRRTENSGSIECLRYVFSQLIFNLCSEYIRLLYSFYRARFVYDWWWIFARLWQLASVYLEIWCDQGDVEFWNKVPYVFSALSLSLHYVRLCNWYWNKKINAKITAPPNPIMNQFSFGWYSITVLSKTVFLYVSKRQIWLVLSTQIK
jgi:hypothetical protein